MEVKCIPYCVDSVIIVKLIGLWVNLMGKIPFDLFDGWRGVCFIYIMRVHQKTLTTCIYFFFTCSFYYFKKYMYTYVYVYI